MPNPLRVLTILLIATIGSGCVTTYSLPLCLEDKPKQYNMSIEEQALIHPSVLYKIGSNDLQLKNWITTSIRLTDEHNKQHKQTCEDLQEG
jgi:hypothetical protein